MDQLTPANEQQNMLHILVTGANRYNLPMKLFSSIFYTKLVHT
jgi:hypothetical protein